MSLHEILGASFGRAACLLALLCLPAAGTARGEDWPQAAHDPQRTAHSADQPNGPFTLAWRKHWDGESIFNRQQPIVIGTTVYVGTQKGVVHAVDLAGGNDLWASPVGGPITHALAGDSRHVYAAAVDGAFYALDARTGRQAWRCPLSRRGFTVAPLLMGGVLYAGCRDGLFYAVDASSGQKLWQFDTGAPIDHTAAGAEGRVVFANEAMQVFCLDARTGARLWTGQASGRTLRDWWPVIHQGKLVIRTAEPGSAHLTGHMRLLDEQLKPKATTPEQVVAEQVKFQKFFEDNPFNRTAFVYNLADGTEPYVCGVPVGCRNTGVPPPPVLAGDGRLYTTYRTSAGKAGLIDITDCGVGHFNLDTGRIDAPLLVGAGTGRRPPFELTSDETVALASGGNLIIGMRADTDPGAVDVTTGATFGTSGVGGIPRASDMQPGGNGIAVSGKYILYVKFSTVVCVQGSDAPSRPMRGRE